MTYLKYHYDNKTHEISPYTGRKSRKTRYIDAANNRYASDSYDKDQFYQKRIDYNNNVMLTKRDNNSCHTTTLKENFELKQFYDNRYNPNSGVLNYQGLVEIPWDRSQKFHAFVEKVKPTKPTDSVNEDVYYYS